MFLPLGGPQVGNLPLAAACVSILLRLDAAGVFVVVLVVIVVIVAATATFIVVDDPLLPPPQNSFQNH